ncbi:hypothetical protein QUA70_22105 [Microcoleus sp. LAD1_D5]
MIAFIVPRREAGAAGGLPHLRFRLLGVAGCDRPFFPTVWRSNREAN